MLTPSNYSPCVGIRTCSDYSPFGVELDGRTVSGGYRFGFQNQEKDDEIKGEGNSYTAEYWEYDSRLGRRWNLDPIIKEHESSYASFANNPIWFRDPNGADSTISNFNSSWKWTVEKNDTYESISKRTNVKLSKLKRLNKNQNLEVGTVIKLSRKKGKENIYPGNEIKTSQGSIYVEMLAENNHYKYGSGLIYLVSFVPNDNQCEYLWFQTIASNFPKETAKWQENDNARANDGISGMQTGNYLVKNFEENNNYIFHNGFYSFDTPFRPFLKDKTIKWRGNLQLIEKINNSYVVIATLQLNFTIQNNKLIDSKLRVNTNLSDEDREYQQNAIENMLNNNSEK